MTNYNIDIGLKFLIGSPNRWINSEIPRMKEVQEWLDLDETLIGILKDNRFPKDQSDFSMIF